MGSLAEEQPGKEIWVLLLLSAYFQHLTWMPRPWSAYRMRKELARRSAELQVRHRTEAWELQLFVVCCPRPTWVLRLEQAYQMRKELTQQQEH